MATVDDHSTEGDQRRNGSEDLGGSDWLLAPNGSPAPPDRRRESPGLRRRLRMRVHDWRLRLVTFADQKALRERVLKPVKWVKRWLQRMSLMWGGARRKLRPQVWASILLTAVLAATIVGAALDFMFGWTPPVHPRAECHRHEFGCGVLGATLVTVFAAALAFTWLILVRVFRIVNWGYARDARKSPSEYVATAADIDEVVGRDDLCRVIEKELRARATRRPQVIVGGVGAGKTAVLVRLTQWLAERGAVPVAVRMRDMRDDEGLHDLAARRFKTSNEHRFKSDDEADRIWRRLCANGVVVVLADGLEEALSGTDARETSIRQALDDARRRELPMVVTSRPDDVLVTLDAALIELGPVDEQQALEYVKRSRKPDDVGVVEASTLRSLMSAAMVADMPLYLQLTHDLYQHNLLKPEDLRDLDHDHRLDIRLRLLERWRCSVEKGRLARNPSITPDQRAEAIKQLSAVAALALIHDTLELKFKTLIEPSKDSSSQAGDANSGLAINLRRLEVRMAPPSNGRLVDADPVKARAAANIGARLGIVQTLRGGVRFRHSIMEAYLGSLWIREKGLTNDGYLTAGLKHGGREFLMALTMACASYASQPRVPDDRDDVLTKIAKRLSSAALEAPRSGRASEDWQALLIAAAYEIDRMAAGQPGSFLKELCSEAWPADSSSQQMEAAKRLVVDRIAETRSAEGYQALYGLCKVERSYRVRVAAAQHMGSGGDVASRALRDAMQRTLDDARAAKRTNFAGITDKDLGRCCLQGWILPLMVASAHDERDAMLKLLDEWLKVCDGAPPSFHACVAQGLKYEANRVLRPGDDREAREHLVRHALALMERTDYWFTRVTLLHAMTLWMLSESARPSGNQQGWFKHRAGAEEHLFVRAAADLCSRALATGNPSPYIWIDETGIVAKLGQQCATVDLEDAPSLWLTESVGWVALKPRAARPVGDVLLMLNLTDGPRRDNKAAIQFDRLRHACRPDLPPCMMRRGQRASLGVLKGEDERSWVLPSITCEGSCQFHLCPYPQTGNTLRPDFSESFCRRLATVRGRSEWQQMKKRELHEFWREMERRARAG